MTYKSIFERLKEERKRLGLTQAAAAQATGVKRETWSRYESGILSPGMEVLVALAQLNADINYILTGQRSGSAVAVKPIHSKEKQFLLDAYDEMTDEQRRAVVEVSKVFAQPKPNKTAG